MQNKYVGACGGISLFCHREGKMQGLELDDKDDIQLKSHEFGFFNNTGERGFLHPSPSEQIPLRLSTFPNQSTSFS